MADSNSEPVICPCGFFGRPETSGLCSKCYRAREKNAPEKTAATAASSASSVSSEAFSKAVQQVTNSTPATPAIHSVAGSSSALPTPSPPDEAASLTGGGASPNGTKSSSKDAAAAGEDDSAISSAAEDSEAPVSAVTSDTSQSDGPSQKNKKRCYKCNVKLQPAVRTIGICKCEFIFCQLHRLPEQHDCMYDHKEKGRQQAREKMISPKKHMGTTLKRIDSDS